MAPPLGDIAHRFWVRHYERLATINQAPIEIQLEPIELEPVIPYRCSVTVKAAKLIDESKVSSPGEAIVRPTSK